MRTLTCCRVAALALLAAVLFGSQNLRGQTLTGAFSYQGRLVNESGPVTEPVNMRFSLYAQASGGSPSGTVTVSDITPTDGEFTVQLDFGSDTYLNARRWLEIEVAYAPSGAYTVLTPRQELTITPHAAFSLLAANAAHASNATSAGTAGYASSAGTATSATNANNAQLLGNQPLTYFTNANNLSTGTLPSGRLAGTYTGAVSFTNVSNSFGGQGTSLTNLNASNLALGTLPDGRLSGSYSGALQFTNPSNVFHGSGANLTSLNPANIAGTIPDSKLSTNVAMLNLQQTFTGMKRFNAGIGLNTLPYDSLLQVEDTGVYSITSRNARAGQSVAVRGIQRTGASVTPDTGAAVFGTSDTGLGVAGASETDTGVWGTANAPGGSGDGVRGLSRGSGAGVRGVADNVTTAGRGVRGEAMSASGVGVEGVNLASSGPAYGVRGESGSTAGVGVAGFASATSGPAYGVRGECASSTLVSAGVFGNTTGWGYGVLGGARYRLPEGSPAGGAGVFGVSWDSAAVVGFTWSESYTNEFGVWGASYNGHEYAAGVRGDMIDGSGSGVSGQFHSTLNAAGYGGKFLSTSTAGYGVLAATANSDIGVGSPAGVLAQGGTGLRGESTVSNGNGVVGFASGESGYAIYGSSIDGFAGFFAGRVAVTGDLYVAGSKNFSIDHPLDPARKVLVHGCVESDERINIYRGNVVLDGNGEAIVTLPEWFDAINRDFTYQLTPIGAAAPMLHIATEIESNAFQIAGGQAGLKVSWTITAIRNDAYARDHPFQVEVDKLEHEVGTYLYPKGFGQSDELSIARAKNRLPTAPVDQDRLPPSPGQVVSATQENPDQEK